MTDVSTLRLYKRIDVGSGPAIVLLHGINANAEDWRGVIDRIGPDYRCVAYDLLGFGESPKPLDIDYSADEHTAVLHASLEDDGVSGRFVLVGYSLGGDIAVRYASTHPERLRRLFLLSAPFYLPAGDFSRTRFGPEFLQQIGSKAIWALLSNSKERNNAIYGLVSGRLEEFAKGFLHTDDVGEHWDIMSANLTNTIAAATFVDDLPRLTMPTVFALGVRDPIVRPDQTPALKRLKPDIEIRRIVGLTADHMMLANLPERVADEILRDEVRGLHEVFRGGSGEPIVLLHGLNSQAKRLVPLARALAVDAEVAVYDLLGFGGSPAPLSSHYTLEDHAAAVLASIRRDFGGRTVRLVGHGLGGLVALACADARPNLISQVVAFSPTLIPPCTTAEEYAKAPAAAEALAARETLREAATSELAQTVSSERLSRRIVPQVRSIDTIVETDSEALLRRVSVPVRFVAPEDDPLVPREWLAGVAAGRQDFELAEVPGGLNLPYEQPAEALKSIVEPTAGQASEARRQRPVPADARTSLAAMLGGANAVLARRGAVMFAVGLAGVLVPGIPPRLVTTGIAIWLLVEAIQTIIGAVGLRREGKGWLPWALIGTVSVLFSGLILASDAFAVGLTRLAIALWALGRGMTDLYVAMVARATPGHRWSLAAEGVLALSVGVALAAVPALGGPLLRYTVGGYLLANGASSLAFAWKVRHDTKKRIAAIVSTPGPGRARR